MKILIQKLPPLLFLAATAAFIAAVWVYGPYDPLGDAITRHMTDAHPARH